MVDKEEFNNCALDLISDGWIVELIELPSFVHLKKEICVKITKPASNMQDFPTTFTSFVKNSVTITAYKKSLTEIEEFCDRVSDLIKLRLNQIIFIPNYTMPDVNFYVKENGELPSGDDVYHSILDMMERSNSNGYARKNFSEDSKTMNCIVLEFDEKRVLEHLTTQADFSKIKNIISEIKELEYILNDDGFMLNIETGKTGKKIFIYISRKNVDSPLGNLMYRYTSDDSIQEFIERTSEILEKNGYFQYSVKSEFFIEHIPYRTEMRGDLMKYTFRIKTL